MDTALFKARKFCWIEQAKILLQQHATVVAGGFATTEDEDSPQELRASVLSFKTQFTQLAAEAASLGLSGHLCETVARVKLLLTVDDPNWHERAHNSSVHLLQQPKQVGNDWYRAAVKALLQKSTLKSLERLCASFPHAVRSVSLHCTR